MDTKKISLTLNKLDYSDLPTKDNIWLLLGEFV